MSLKLTADFAVNQQGRPAVNELFLTRIDYLLLSDFNWTVERWRKDKAALVTEVWKSLQQADLYEKTLKNRGDLMCYEIDELVNHSIVPNDVSEVYPPNIKLYSKIMEWAEEEADKPIGKEKTSG